MLTAAILCDFNPGIETARCLFKLLNMLPLTRAPLFRVAMDFDFTEKARYFNRLFFVIVTATTTPGIRMARGFTVSDQMTHRRGARLTRRCHVAHRLISLALLLNNQRPKVLPHFCRVKTRVEQRSRFCGIFNASEWSTRDVMRL